VAWLVSPFQAGGHLLMRQGGRVWSVRWGGGSQLPVTAGIVLRDDSRVTVIPAVDRRKGELWMLGWRKPA